MLLVLHAALTWALVGLILTIQLVHYPLFARVGAAGYTAYQREHITRITWLVAPLMLAELGTGAWLALNPPPGVPGWSAWLGLGLIVLIWLSTALVQSPLHGRLIGGFDAVHHARLVGSNAGRTGLWLARGVLVSWWLWRALHQQGYLPAV